MKPVGRYFRVHPNASALERRRRHADLRNKFNTAPDPVYKKIGNLLGDLIELRVLADYEMGQLNFRGAVLTPDILLWFAQIYANDLLEALQEFPPARLETDVIAPMGDLNRSSILRNIN